MTKSQKHKRKS